MGVVPLLAVLFSLVLAACTLIGLYIAYRRLYRDQD
jgi:hypothetical protein